MMQMLQKALDWFKALFWKEEMELTLVGLQVVFSKEKLQYRFIMQYHTTPHHTKLYYYPKAIQTKLYYTSSKQSAPFHTTPL